MIQHFRDEIELDEHLSGLLLRALRANRIDKYLFRQRRWGWEIDFSVGVANRKRRFHAEFNTQENNRFTLLNSAPTRNPELLNRTNISDSSAREIIKIAMELITKPLELPREGPETEP